MIFEKIEGEEMKSGRVKKLLEGLKDGKWHKGIFIKGVGPETVNLCYELGLVRIKKFDVKRQGDIESYRFAVQITKAGEKALKK